MNWYWKRYGRNAIAIAPRIGRWVPQIGVYTKTIDRRFLGVAWELNDDDEHRLTVGVWFVTVEVEFHEYDTREAG